MKISFSSSDSNVLLELTNRACFLVSVSDIIRLIARVKKQQVSARAILHPLADENDRIGADSLGCRHSTSCISSSRGSGSCNCWSILVLSKYGRVTRTSDNWNNRQGLASYGCVDVAKSILLSCQVLCVRYLSDAVLRRKKHLSVDFKSINFVILDNNLAEHGQQVRIGEIVA